MSCTKTLNFGVLLIPLQAIDVTGPLDLLNSCTPAFLSALASTGHPVASKISPSQCIDLSYHFIGETHDSIKLHTGFSVIPTVTVDEILTSNGFEGGLKNLDYLLVGGPDPSSYVLGEKFKALIRAFVESFDDEIQGKKKILFTTCTGAMAIAPAGVLDGRKATTNHGALPIAENVFPAVKWVKEQWVVDERGRSGEIWTSGGAVAGMDMFINWIIHNYGLDVAKMAGLALDFEPRDISGNFIWKKSE